MWGCEREQTAVSVIVAENDVLKAIVTPQWGGKIWSVYHKKLKREFFMRNPAMREYLSLRALSANMHYVAWAGRLASESYAWDGVRRAD